MQLHKLLVHCELGLGVNSVAPDAPANKARSLAPCHHIHAGCHGAKERRPRLVRLLECGRDGAGDFSCPGSRTRRKTRDKIDDVWDEGSSLLSRVPSRREDGIGLRRGRRVGEQS